MLSDTTFFARWHGKTGPLKITTKAEGCTESRSSCHRCITIYCIKALVQGLKGIAFHSNNEIILCTINPLLSPPSQIRPLPLLSPPPFQGKKWLVISPPPPFPLLSRCKWGSWPVFITMKKDQGYCCAASIWMGCKFIAQFPTHMPFLIYFLGGV